MSCIIFPSIKQYLTNARDLKERIVRLEQLIDAMILSTLNTIDSPDYNPNVSQYRLNDGQMIVETTYKSNSDVLGAIKELEKVKQLYMNQYNGRVMTSRDIRSLNKTF